MHLSILTCTLYTWSTAVVRLYKQPKRIFEAQGKGGMQNSKITGVGFTEQKQFRNKVKYIPFSDSFAVTVSQFVLRTGGPIAFALSPPDHSTVFFSLAALIPRKPLFIDLGSGIFQASFHTSKWTVTGLQLFQIKPENCLSQLDSLLSSLPF